MNEIRSHGDEIRRIETILAEMKTTEGRDLQLWSVGALLFLVLVAGVASVVIPLEDYVELEPGFLVVGLYGLVSLVVLFNIYVLQQKRNLRTTRADLVRQLLRAEGAEIQAMTDPLTGLLNRRYLDYAMKIEVKRARRTGYDLSILICDLDGFGDVNKELGYLAGDEMLREFAEMLQTVFRQTDTVARLGGDEFVVLLTEADLDKADLARRRLLVAIDRRNEGQDVDIRRIRCSTGLAQHTDGEEVSATLGRADEALRRARAERRGGVSARGTTA